MNEEKKMRNASSPDLTLSERLRIRKLLDDGWSMLSISKEMGRGKTTIQFEVKRNGGPYIYDPHEAHNQAHVRKMIKSRNTSESLKEFYKPEGLNIDLGTRVKKLEQRIESMQMHLEILIEQLRKLNGKN